MLTKAQIDYAREAAKKTADKYCEPHIRTAPEVVLDRYDGVRRRSGRGAYFTIDQLTAISAFLAYMPADAMYGGHKHKDVFEAWGEGIGVPMDVLKRRLTDGE